MKGMEATRQSGQSRGTVGVTPTGIEIGIDVGIGQLGISTDYGGGIVIGIGGQKIVWGAEGGKINYNVGGFEVTVEARDCVVVETRKIAGQIVGIHTYPDPGCKLPEPPTPTPTPTPTSDPNVGIKIPQTEDFYWVPVIRRVNYYNPKGSIAAWIETKPSISDKEKEKTVTKDNFPFTMYTTESAFPAGQTLASPITTLKNTSAKKGSITTNDRADFRFKDSDGVSVVFFKTWQNGALAGFIDTGVNINRFLTRIEENNKEYLTAPNVFGYGNAYVSTFKPIDYVIVGKQKSPTQFLPPPGGNQPPMPDKCCEALKADIEDIKEVLATKEILAGKMTFPWSWRMPGGQGNEVIMDYPNLARAIAQMIDHLGIHPPKLSVKDINNAIAGDQGLTNQFPSATQGFEALMAQVWDANSDVDTLTNFLYRLSWLNVQQTMNMAKISAKVEAICDMVGGETESGETEITTPFNIGAGVKEKSTKGKGFGKNQIDSKIDANTEIATESLLPDFLKVRKNPITVERFSGGADLNDKIDMIILKL